MTLENANGALIGEERNRRRYGRYRRGDIERRSGAFEPASSRDRYKEALRELVEAKTKGLATTARTIAETP